jgi:hypothetical protein
MGKMTKTLAICVWTSTKRMSGAIKGIFVDPMIEGMKNGAIN